MPNGDGGERGYPFPPKPGDVYRPGELERFDILLYTSQAEFDDEAATRDGYDMTRAQISAEVHDFELEYQAYMVQNQGRLILVVTPSRAQEKRQEQRKAAEVALACPHRRLTHRKPLVSPGPDHNPVGWKPETDIPDGNRLESIREPIQATLAHLDRQYQAEAGIAPHPVLLEPTAPIQAAVYLAVPQAHMENLFWRRVTIREFPPGVTAAGLLEWLDSVQDLYGFGPEEVFYVRDWPSWELEEKRHMLPCLSEYELDLLARREV